MSTATSLLPASRANEPAGPAGDDPLVALNQWLRQTGYRFTTVTPATHARVFARSDAPAGSLRDVFGWSRPFLPEQIGPQALGWLRQAGLLQQGERGPQESTGLLRSAVRFSSIGDLLFSHSAWPTTAADAVFFGPDTYRFAALIEAELDRQPLPENARVADIGCGSGAGGIVAARQAGAGARLFLADINPAALRHALANAEAAGLTQVHCAEGDLYQPLTGAFDLLVSNPPYLVDRGARAYRHGGGALGTALSERIVAEGLPRLAPGGRLVLYTGVAMVEGADPFLAGLRPVLAQSGWPYSYRELDPDVFGEELDEPAYAAAERIAAVALVVQRPAA